MQQIDLTVFQWLNAWAGRNETLDWVIVFAATYLLYCLVAAVFLSYSFDSNVPRVKKIIIHAFAAGFLSRIIFTEIIRFFYDKPRPFQVLSDVHQLIERTGGGAMPSGHAAFSFAVAAAMYFYYPRTSIVFFFAALVIGAGRVAAGVHWPSDILAGAVVGILSAWLVDFLLKKLQYK